MSTTIEGQLNKLRDLRGLLEHSEEEFVEISVGNHVMLFDTVEFERLLRGLRMYRNLRNDLERILRQRKVREDEEPYSVACMSQLKRETGSFRDKQLRRTLEEDLDRFTDEV